MKPDGLFVCCVSANCATRFHFYHVNIFSFISGINVILNSKSPIPDICTYNSACTSDIISERMKLNLRLLLDKYPGGIWCSELPHLYKVNCTVTVLVVFTYLSPSS